MRKSNIRKIISFIMTVFLVLSMIPGMTADAASKKVTVYAIQKVEKSSSYSGKKYYVQMSI